MKEHKTKIILASQSPRRRELLSKAGYEFEVIPSSAEEIITCSKPDEIVKELSQIKAKDILEQIMQGEELKIEDEYNSVIVIGADTVVSKDGQIMGKPKSEEEAYQMIDSIQGRTHQVYTGVTILKWVKNTEQVASKSFAECTNVTIYEMTDAEIKDYIATGDCMDKAGSYGIQGEFGVFVKKIDGDYNNVVGLPIARLYHVLKESFV